MTNKTLRLIGLVLLLLVIIATALGITEDVKKIGYFSEAKKSVTALKALTWEWSDTSDKLGVDNTWTTYVVFALSPIAMVIVGLFNWAVYKNIKNGTTIPKWPLIVVVVFAGLAIVAPLLELATGADSKYSISNLAEIKKNSTKDYDIIVNTIKPIYNANTIPALGYVGMAMSIVEGVIALPTLLQLKNINN